MAGAGQEQGRSRAEQSRAGQKEGRSWAGTGKELGMCQIGAWKEQGRSTAGQKLELGRSRVGAEQENKGYCNDIVYLFSIPDKSWKHGGDQIHGYTAGKRLQNNTAVLAMEMWRNRTKKLLSWVRERWTRSQFQRTEESTATTKTTAMTISTTTTTVVVTLTTLCSR